MYLRPLGQGTVLYNTLGHCRGHYDMTPMRRLLPEDRARLVGPCPQYYELLRRSIRWAKGATPDG